MPEELHKAKKAIEKKVEWKKHAVPGKHYLAGGCTVHKVAESTLSEKERAAMEDNLTFKNLCRVTFIDEKYDTVTPTFALQNKYGFSTWVTYVRFSHLLARKT